MLVSEMLCRVVLHRNLAVVGGVVLLLAETRSMADGRSLFAGLPSAGDQRMPRTYMQLGGRVLLVAMFLTLLRLDFTSPLPVIQDVVGTALVLSAYFFSNSLGTITHTHPLNRVSQYQKGKPIWVLLKQETVCGSGISWSMCKSAPRSRQITMPAPHHSFLQARCPSCHPTNGVKALKALELLRHNK